MQFETTVTLTAIFGLAGAILRLIFQGGQQTAVLKALGDKVDAIVTGTDRNASEIAALRERMNGEIASLREASARQEARLDALSMRVNQVESRRT